MGPTVHANKGRAIHNENGIPTPKAIPGRAAVARNPANAPLPSRSQT